LFFTAALADGLPAAFLTFLLAVFLAGALPAAAALPDAALPVDGLPRGAAEPDVALSPPAAASQNRSSGDFRSWSISW